MNSNCLPILRTKKLQAVVLSSAVQVIGKFAIIALTFFPGKGKEGKQKNFLFQLCVQFTDFIYGTWALARSFISQYLNEIKIKPIALNVAHGNMDWYGR